MTIASTSIVFKKIKKTLFFNIDEVYINKIFLSDQAPYGEQRSYKYYIAYLGVLVLDHCTL